MSADPGCPASVAGKAQEGWEQEEALVELGDKVIPACSLRAELILTVQTVQSVQFSGYVTITLYLQAAGGAAYPALSRIGNRTKANPRL